MAEPIPAHLEATRLLLGLQQANRVAQQLSGSQTLSDIAHIITDGLVKSFDCAFARVWVVEPDQQSLRLIASSGLYTRLDGSFARVPMGAFKVGKIAQNRVSFLSNHLADESWVKDREWALANQIQGFAGYPLVIQDQVIGVLAVFSHQAMDPEFLEVLLSLSTTLSVALDMALRHEQEKQTWQRSQPSVDPLSDQLAHILPNRLTLVGTERPLDPSASHLLLQTASHLHQLDCLYARLIYGAEGVTMEGTMRGMEAHGYVQSLLAEVLFGIQCWGGSLHITSPQSGTLQVVVFLPYRHETGDLAVQIQCRQPMVQTALTHLAHQAGLAIIWDSIWKDPPLAHGHRVSRSPTPMIPLITDDCQAGDSDHPVIWIRTGLGTPLPRVRGVVDLSLRPEELRQAVETVTAGGTWGLDQRIPEVVLSDREGEVMRLLADGCRDREIAQQMHISESTVKFHIKNVLLKLKARTRFHALYQLMGSPAIGP